MYVCEYVCEVGRNDTILFSHNLPRIPEVTFLAWGALRDSPGTNTEPNRPDLNRIQFKPNLHTDFLTFSTHPPSPPPPQGPPPLPSATLHPSHPPTSQPTLPALPQYGHFWWTTQRKIQYFSKNPGGDFFKIPEVTFSKSRR